MSAMTEEIDPTQSYTTREVAQFTGLSDRQVVRLVDDGQFPGSYRKSPVPGSPRMVLGSAVIAFLEQRQVKQQN